MLAIKIAWRNLYRHRGKSLVIGTILFLGAFFLTLGNSVISGMDKGLDQSVVNGFTGDVVMVSKDQVDNNVLLSMQGKAIEDIHSFDTLRPHLEASGILQTTLPVGKGFALAINEQDGAPGYAFLFGVNFKKWREMFPSSLKILQGSYPDSTGLLLSTGGQEQLFRTMGILFQPKDAPLDTSILNKGIKEAFPNITVQRDLVFMGFNEANTSSDIRLPLAGISKFRALNTIWGHFLFVDIESYRQCMGYFTSTDQTSSLSTVQKDLLSSDNANLDAMFGAAEPTTPDNKKSITAPQAQAPAPAVVEAPKPRSEESGVYQLVLGRFKPGIDRSKGIDSLNHYLTASNVPLRALTWQQASGPIGSMTIIIKVALNVFVLFLFFVAIIIIVNTLSMAAMERTSEIGMMRAVGAQKSFISKMFLLETGFLSFVFGALGILVGLGVVVFVRYLNLTTDNDMLQLFYGGDTFRPIFGLGDFALTVLQLALVTGLASIYPIFVAKSITPLDAISRD